MCGIAVVCGIASDNWTQYTTERLVLNSFCRIKALDIDKKNSEALEQQAIGRWGCVKGSAHFTHGCMGHLLFC